MKVFIHHRQKKETAIFEGARMRKTLKGACEAVGVEWVDSPHMDAEIAHFISPRDLHLARAEKERGSKIVVSAFYCESDPEACFFKETWTGNEKLSKKGRQMLEVADLILVPSEGLRRYLVSIGLQAKIDVLRPTVDLRRFSGPIQEAMIFPRYFTLPPNAKTVIATGSYADKKTLDFIKNVAKACPKIDFYFFGVFPKRDGFGLSRAVALVKKPKNLHLLRTVQDDIYRSGILNCLAYISNDSLRPDAIRSLEAFAAKRQVLVIGPSRKKGENLLLEEGSTCFYFDDPEKMGKYLLTLYQGSAPSTIISAYKVAESHSLPYFGKKLKEEYESLIRE